MHFSSLSLLLLSASAIAHGPTRPQNHQHVKRRFEIDDRGLPITATTTIRVQKTLTETIWVQPTGQVVFEPTSVAASASASASASSASELPSESSSAVQSGSTSESAFSTASQAPSASASESAEVSSTESLSPSSSMESIIPSESATFSDSASAIPSTTESATPSESSEAVSVSASRSASRTNRPSGSATASAESTSIEASASESATFSDSASAIPSTTESATSSESSEAVSVSASRSASRTNRPSGSVTMSSSTESVSAEPTSTEVSASVSASASSSFSRSASRSNRNSATASSSTSAAQSTSSAESSLAEASSTSSTSAAAPSATRVAGQVRSGLLMNGYYPDWSAWKLAPENVDWSKFDVIDFAFAIPTAEFGLVFTQDDSASLLNRLVASAHAADKFVKLSIGGWTGSVHFSDACRTAENRQTFIGHIVDAYYAYKLDGIDLDWEYPGTGGAWNNVVTGADSANFLSFLQELRAALPQGALITAATQVWPFADEKGNPMRDVSAFAKVLDWILIMNYDIWGSSVNGEQPGPNAPLKTCDGSGQPLANAYAAISSWTTAGFPANQITLGVPAYGYLSKSTAWSLRHRRSNKPQRRADVTIYNDNGGTADGQIQFWNLVAQGALYKDESGNYVGAGGFTRSWDDCSETPWIRSGSSGQIITYDDPQSLSLKGQFAAQAGLRGCNVFSMDGDTASGELVSSVRSGMGI